MEARRARRSRIALTLLPGLLVAAMASAAPPAGPPGRPDFLTGPSAAAPRDVALAHARAARIGVADGGASELVVREEFTSAHNGVTHVYLRQRHHGLDVVNGDLGVHVDRQGRILNVGHRRAPRASLVVPPPEPELTSDLALGAAAVHLGLAPATPATVLRGPGGPERRAIFRQPALSRDEIPARLVYRAGDDGLRLAWEIVVRTPGGGFWGNVWVNASSGAVLDTASWIDDASYEVFALPVENPDLGARTVEVDPHDPVASPFGWHDTNGVPGAEFTDTRGNNVVAQDDLDANNTGGSRPSGGGALDFQFPLDLTLDPISSLDASLTNLFYWNNLLHDLHYAYGFDEAAGNFQTNNYGMGGLGGDEVLADAQDGEDTNNANFGTPPDGSSPRMQTFIFLPPSPVGSQVVVTAPAAIAGQYVGSAAQFGPTLTLAGTTADLRLADDGVAPTSDGCEAFVPGFFSGEIAVVDRGTCLFVDKVKNAQDAGALAVIVVNDAGDGLVSMAGDDPTLVIPSAFLGQSDGDTIKAQLPGVNAQVGAIPFRDGALDSALIAHEYGHGVSNRLTGGSGNVNCLDNDEQMGEGWSDFHALALTALPTHTATTVRPFGAYLEFQPPDGTGFRNFSYTTDMAVNPQTYADIATTNLPHGVGEIWAAMLWETYWNLVEDDGFDADLLNGTGGNNLALQLVMDGLKLQPCSPSFVDGRDAILMADMVNNGGINQCRIWQAFAKRGLGFSANAGSAFDVTDGSEAFDLPPACLTACSNGIDDDGDGRIDFDPVTNADAPTYTAGTGDPGCSSPGATSEAPRCQDGVNNDPGVDALLDFDGGQSVHGACGGGVCPPGVSDPDLDGVADPDPGCGVPWSNEGGGRCGLGFELALLLPLLSGLRRRRSSRA